MASRDSLGVRGVAVECVHCGHNAVTLAKSLDLDLRRVYDVLKIMDLLGFVSVPCPSAWSCCDCAVGHVVLYVLVFVVYM